jgi:hypothetical protein
MGVRLVTNTSYARFKAELNLQANKDSLKRWDEYIKQEITHSVLQQALQ